MRQVLSEHPVDSYRLRENEVEDNFLSRCCTLYQSLSHFQKPRFFLVETNFKNQAPNGINYVVPGF